MSDTPKARIELNELRELLKKRDLPKLYIIKQIEYAMLFMFKDKEPDISIKRPVLEDFLDIVEMVEVESVFDQLQKIGLNERDQKFLKSLLADYDKYGSLTVRQWPALLKMKDKYEKGLGVV